MKNLSLWMIAFLALFSSASFAWTDENAYLRINIQNNTPETCTLTRSKVVSGKLSSLVPMQKEILSGTTATILVSENLKAEAAIELSYTCGASRIISFYSERNTFFKTQDVIRGQILLAVDMDAIYQIQHGTILGGYLEAKAGSIYWILS